MSDVAPARGIVLSHGALAEGLIDAVQRIVGGQGDALLALSNCGLSPEALVAAVRERAGAGPVVLFTDLPGGSCGITARRLCQERCDMLVVCGVNLPILLEFVLNRHLPLDELAERLTDKGRTSIHCAPTNLTRHAPAAASGR
jgi:PTS system mannose-specific IIA component